MTTNRDKTVSLLDKIIKMTRNNYSVSQMPRPTLLDPSMSKYSFNVSSIVFQITLNIFLVKYKKHYFKMIVSKILLNHKVTIYTSGISRNALPLSTVDKLHQNVYHYFSNNP